VRSRQNEPAAAGNAVAADLITFPILPQLAGSTQHIGFAFHFVDPCDLPVRR
jgi:hypothetical protein